MTGLSFEPQALPLSEANLDSMFEAVELPASVADLATGLTNVDGDALALKEE